MIHKLVISDSWYGFPNQRSVSSPKAKLRNAAKSRLNRWVKPHARRSELNAPEWLIEQWKNGCKNDIADLLSQENFNKDWSTH